MIYYEKTIGLKKILKTLIRRWKVFLIVFIPISLTATIYSQLFVKKKYSSSVTMMNDSFFNQNQYNEICYQVLSDETITETIDRLTNGDQPIIIDKLHLKEGISIAEYDITQRTIFTFSYSSSERNAVLPVLSVLAEVALNNIKSNVFSNMDYESPVSHFTNVKKTSMDTAYLTLGLLSAFVLGCSVAFLCEVFSDEIFDKDDIETYGHSAFDLNTKK